MTDISPAIDARFEPGVKLVKLNLLAWIWSLVYNNRLTSGGPQGIEPGYRGENERRNSSQIPQSARDLRLRE